MGLVRSGHHSDHMSQKSLFCKNKQIVTVLQLLWKYVCIGQVEEPREQWAGGRGIWERGLGCHLSSGEDSPHPRTTMHQIALFCIKEDIKRFFFYFRALPNYLYQKYLDWFSLVSFKLPLTDSDSEMTIKLQKTGWNLATSYEMMVEPLGCWSN